MKSFIILLFFLFVGTMSLSAAAEHRQVVGTVAAIKQRERELLVIPGAEAAPGSGPAEETILHVRLAWGDDADVPFTTLLPACVMPGSRIVLRGEFLAGAVFRADSIRGCGADSPRDRTGVRLRLNRAGILLPAR